MMTQKCDEYIKLFSLYLE